MKSPGKVKNLSYSVIKEDYRYRLGADYTDSLTLKIKKGIQTKLYKLSPKGTLSIKQAYIWDGATGIPDTTSVFRASLVHDCLYQMMRENGLSTQYRKNADKIFYDLCRADGLNKFVAWLYYLGVRIFGWTCANKTGYQVIRKIRKYRRMVM